MTKQSYDALGPKELARVRFALQVSADISSFGSSVWSIAGNHRERQVVSLKPNATSILCSVPLTPSP